MFTEITINNFRILEQFTCRDFKTINVVGGDNNVGKTTLLEALFLLSGYSDISFIQRLFNWRGLIMEEKRDLKILFSRLDINKNIKISGKYNDNEIKLDYEPLVGKDGDILGIEYNFKFNGKGSGSSIIKYNPEQQLIDPITGLKLPPQSPFLLKDDIKKPDLQKIEHISSKIFNADSLPNRVSMSEDFDELIGNGGRDELIQILNEIFNENITEIFNKRSLIKILIKEYKERGALPFNFLGGGMNKLLPILCGIASNKKVLLIDEIENGLHYSKAKQILTFLFNKAIEKKIQLFITSHSADVIKAIVEILNDGTNDEIKENFRFHSLFNNKDGQKEAISYTAE
ncbi:MAG: ATP-binding protein, partial [Alphaproteobacteria bacterium]|nr:ATP-binding protein [Alphaproteobacteria bacterium]